jgi:N-acetylglucosamine-6-sulfatase
MLAVDEAIGRIIDRLTDLDELANTYIVFTSDNGYHLGQHRLLNGKGQIYEEDIRVPLIIRGPGIPAGTTQDHFVLNIDLAPTFADLGKVKPAHVVDGRSMVPLLSSTPVRPHQWRDDFLIELWRPANQGGEEIRALRTRGWFPLGPIRGLPCVGDPAIYVEYLSGARELYNLFSDPFELTSVHQSLPRGWQRRWSNRLQELSKASGKSAQ